MATATATKTRKLTVLCPFCLDTDATVKMSLGSMVCECGGCGEEFTPAEAAARLAKMAEAWSKVAAWADAFPSE
jgi:transcription elongation factor Elf1